MSSGRPLPQDREPSSTIAPAAERTGLSNDTLRCYEKAGLQRFAGLRAEGHGTVADRPAMLREHPAVPADRIRAPRRNASALHDKIALPHA
ncbi:hypothetical protein ABZ864_28385 [Streptomyces sp. NPDC047082]|uniref:hypothetical protein n=1 Tax=Streptomyces sp. NPDC047082 TaxID=3155259 RepID=UPI0033C31299